MFSIPSYSFRQILKSSNIATELVSIPINVEMTFKVRIDFTVENIRFQRMKDRVTELAKCFERLNSLFDDSIVIK